MNIESIEIVEDVALLLLIGVFTFLSKKANDRGDYVHGMKMASLGLAPVLILLLKHSM